MRILIVSDMYWPHVSGVSTATSQLATQLHLQGHNVGLVVPRSTAGIAPNLPDGVTVFPIPTVRMRLIGQQVPFGIPTRRTMSAIMRTFTPPMWCTSKHR